MKIWVHWLYWTVILGVVLVGFGCWQHERIYTAKLQDRIRQIETPIMDCSAQQDTATSRLSVGTVIQSGDCSIAGVTGSVSVSCGGKK